MKTTEAHLSSAYSDRDGLNEQSIARGSNVWARFKFEWKLENLLFSGNYPTTYGRLHWPRAFGTAGSGCWCCSRARGDERSAEYPLVNPKLWLVWRVMVAIYMTGVLIWSANELWDGGRWLYYLTNWQTIIFAVYSWLALSSAVFLQCRHGNLITGDFTETAKLIGAAKGSTVDYKIPLLLKTSWFFLGLGVTAGFWVTSLFWLNTAVFGFYDPSKLTLQLVDHASTFALMLIDFSLNGYPWMLFQFVWSSIFAFIYIIWTIIFYREGLTNKFDGGRYIYKGVDWADPVRTAFLMIGLVFFAMPVISIVIWMLSSEQLMGKCAPRRLVPWVDVDGTGGHRLVSFKKKTTTKMTPASSSGAPVVQEV